jgi:DNA polymerase-3 subunit gamma/tau
VRRLWPDIVEATKLRRRVAWMHLTQNSQVVGVEGRTLTLGFANAGARDSFVNGGCDEILRQAAIDVVGVDWRVDAIVDPGARADPAAPVVRQPAAAPQEPDAPGPAASAAPDEPPAWAADDQPDAPDAAATAPTAPPDMPPRETRSADPQSIAAARGAIAQTRPSGQATGADPRGDADADAHPDDPDAETSGLGSAELLERELGAQMIEEIRHQ